MFGKGRWLAVAGEIDVWGAVWGVGKKAKTMGFSDFLARRQADIRQQS